LSAKGNFQRAFHTRQDSNSWWLTIAAAGVFCDEPFHIDLDIDHGTNDAPPPRQINVQQNGTAYVWNGSTRELIPILPPDHPDYRQNAAILLEAFPRWN
jgi:hypothetical protein